MLFKVIKCYEDDFVLRFICKALHEMTSRMQSAFLFCMAACFLEARLYLRVVLHACCVDGNLS